MTRPSAGRVAERDAEPRLGARGERVAAGRLAGFGAAQLEHVAAGRLAAEIVVEGDDAMHFGARDIQRFGDQRLGGFVDVAELLLQGVQDRQQRAFKAAVLGDDLRGSFRAPWFVNRHVVYRAPCNRPAGRSHSPRNWNH